MITVLGVGEWTTRRRGLKAEYYATKAALESAGAASDCLAFRTVDIFRQGRLFTPKLSINSSVYTSHHR